MSMCIHGQEFGMCSFGCKFDKSHPLEKPMILQEPQPVPEYESEAVKNGIIEIIPDKQHIRITPIQAAEILSVHNQLQGELTEQDQLITKLRKKIEALEAERETWQEPTQLSADI